MFDISDVTDVTEDLVIAVYELGKAFPRTEVNACEVKPYPSMSDTRFGLGTNPTVLAHEAGVLVGAIAYHPDGHIALIVNNYFTDAHGNYTEKGNTLIKELFAAVKARSSTGKVTVSYQNPNTANEVIEFGGEFE
jgi:hypothetical protein